MTDALIQSGVMTLADFIYRFDTEGAFEIIDEEILPVSPTLFGHNDVSRIVYNALYEYQQKTDNGIVYFETPFILPEMIDLSDWVTGSRIPDVMFISKSRLRDYRDRISNWRKKPLALIPDLVVEVISINDNYTDVNRKTRKYLEDGVKLIWVIDPEEETLIVHQQGDKQQTKLGIKDTVSGGDVLPQFSMPVKNIFA